jgi:uncharacterized protein (TIGR01777 family)
MHIVLTGATGFLGGPLVRELIREHRVTILTRGPLPSPSPGNHSASPRYLPWRPDGTAGDWASVLDGADAVVNLAGEPIAARRWSPQQKRRILDSRILSTRSLVEGMARAASPPATFISASGVGYYGILGDEVVTEDRGPGSDFLAQVCAQWEAEASRASPPTRVVLLRTGIALERDGGALPKMLPPFWAGIGGPLGSGRQYWPWIHRHDWIDLVRFALSAPQVVGALNLTAPEPVTNRAFAHALGRAMRRPALVPTPGFALKLLLGEMAESLLLSGQRAVPAKAQRLGYVFRYPGLPEALAAIFGR